MATGGAAPRPEDMLRILIATDNHLGYADKQPEKEDDSFDTFEEIMQIAKREDVDFVLLGGDLFHENKPTRQSELKAFQVICFMYELQIINHVICNFSQCSIFPLWHF